MRKEWHSLSQAERCEYIDAIITASTDPRYKVCYDALIGIHETYFTTGRIHGGGDTFFLPWHRWYLLTFENLLRKINCKVASPYWDWSLEAKNFRDSVIWDNECGFGGNGSPKEDNVVRTGPFGNDTWVQPNGQPLRREFNGSFLDAGVVSTIQRNTVQQFMLWHQGVEVMLHDSAHCVIGGTMCSAVSSSDPMHILPPPQVHRQTLGRLAEQRTPVLKFGQACPERQCHDRRGDPKTSVQLTKSAWMREGVRARTVATFRSADHAAAGRLAVRAHMHAGYDLR